MELWGRPETDSDEILGWRVPVFERAGLPRKTTAPKLVRQPDSTMFIYSQWRRGSAAGDTLASVSLGPFY